MNAVVSTVALTADHGSARRVVECKKRPDSGQPGRTLLFGGSCSTLGKGALDEELYIQGNRWELTLHCATAALHSTTLPAAVAMVAPAAGGYMGPAV